MCSIYLVIDAFSSPLAAGILPVSCLVHYVIKRLAARKGAIAFAPSESEFLHELEFLHKSSLPFLDVNKR